MCPFDDENDLRRLKPAAIALWHKHKAVEGELDEARARIRALEAELAAKTKKGKGGKGSPSPSAATPTAPAPSASPPDGPPPTAAPRAEQVGHGPRPQPGLEARERVWDLDEPDRVCRACGGALEPFPQADELAEEIDVEARHFVKRVHRRRAYRCGCGACIETAPGPDKLTAGGRYSVDFAVAVAVGKYVDHRAPRRRGKEAVMAS